MKQEKKFVDEASSVECVLSFFFNNEDDEPLFYYQPLP